MANITSKTTNTSPASDDWLYQVDVSDTTDNANGSDKKSTNADVITKAHGLSDGLVKVASGVMTPATSGTDYAPATSGSAILKGNGSGGFSSASEGTDYYGVGGTDVAVTDGGTGASTASGARTNLGIDQIATFVSKVNGTTAPTVNDDSANTSGNGVFSVGSVWIDTTNDKAYDCVDATPTAAVWNLRVSTTSGITAVVDDTTPQLGGDLDVNGHVITGYQVQPSEGAFANGDKTKLDGIETGADVTDATNVDAAGAFMNTDLNAKGDIITATADNTPAILSVGTDGQVLTADSAQANGIKWATPSAGGGQSTYDVIIANSGGDYTTLDAYFTAGATAGDRIFVKDSHTLGAAITSSANNLTIIGAGKNDVVIDMATNSTAITLSGTGVKIEGIGFNTGSTTVKLTISGANARIEDIKLTTAHFPVDTLNCTGSNATITNSSFISTYTSTTTNGALVYISGDYSIFTNNYVESYTSGSSVANSIVRSAGNYQGYTNNTFNATGSTGHDYIFVGCGGGSGTTFTGNTFYSGGATYRVQALYWQGNYTSISGNSFYGRFGNAIAIYGSDNDVSGNNLFSSTTTSSTGIYINSAVDNCVINGNKIKSFGTGLSVNASTCDNNVIVGNSFASCTTTLTDSGTGTIIKNNSGVFVTEEKDFVQATNTSGGTLNAGDIVVLKAVASGREITTTTTAGDKTVFGMVAASSIANNATGLVQTLGKTTVLKADGTTDIAVGDYLSCFTTAKYVQKASTGHMAIAIALEAFTTDSSTGVLDALLITPRLMP